ncbi:MMS19 nucleotide excision repair protein homolog [Paramacrobiotus metropolitanus]|uniref:MMS19 nucleotide excision repair protein homolog n=1 Tax=Paramacrobiotus metropolitanus TaxID=2943436 RepID=UPI0024461C29|nr:MMS19 nucleotide excision repair protein homolog [Paramacrobiotus metropolitanus]
MSGDSVVSEWHSQLMENVKNFDEASVVAIAAEINQRQKVLLHVVEALGPSLTHKDAAIRQEAVRVIVTILEHLHVTALNDGECETLCRFLCDRLRDHQSFFGLVMRGFLALIRMDAFPEDCVITILNALAEDVIVSMMAKNDRYNVYLLVEIMISRFQTVLEKMGPTFLARFVNFMNGEHEPRNLVLCFRLMTRILRKFEIEPMEEMAFDVVACYFPVDFTPSNKEDIESNIRDTLVIGLRRCLTIAPQFAKFLLPLLLEKLMSDLKDAKVEALKTLTACCNSEPPRDVILEHLPVLWPAVRKEILTATSDSIEEAALEALTAVTRYLASGVQQGKNGVDAFVATVIKDVDPYLRKPELQLQQSTGKILRAISLGSSNACSAIATSVLPNGVKLYMDQVQPESRLAIVSVMTLQLRTMAEIPSGHIFTVPDKNSIVTLYQSIISDTPQSMTTCLGISGLAHMLMLRDEKNEPFVELTKVEQICNTFITGIMYYENPGVVDEVINFFTMVGQEEDEQYIYGKLLPKLLEFMQSHEVLPIPQRLLDVATAILKTSRPKRVPTIIPVLLERIQFLDENGPYVPTMKMYLDIIASYVEGIHSPIEADELCELVLLPTFGKAVRAATSENTSGYQDITVLHSLSRVYRAIVSRLDIQSYGQLVLKLDKMYLRGDTTYKEYTTGRKREQLFGGAFKPLEKPYLTTHTRCISIMTSIVCAAPVGFVYVYDEWKADIHKLVEACCFCADEISSVFAAQCIGGILNRVDDDETFDNLLRDIMDEQPLAKARSQERRYLRVLIWITKALVLHGRRVSLILKLAQISVDHLNSKKSGEEAADGFRVVLEDSSFVLNPSMNAIVSPLFRQKFFNVVLPLVLNSYKEIENAEEAWKKRNHLVALSHLLKNVPQIVARPNMPLVVPLLLQSLSSPDIELLISTLNSFEELLTDSDADTVSASLGTPSIPPLIEKLLELCVHQSSMSIRIAALKCLELVSSQLPVPPLLPYKSKVLKRLALCVDDKKRKVREVAVETRGSWFLVGQANKAG